MEINIFTSWESLVPQKALQMADVKLLSWWQSTLWSKIEEDESMLEGLVFSDGCPLLYVSVKVLYFW